MEERVAVQVVPRISELGRDAWDGCAGTKDPFLSYDFLEALEESQSAVAEEGWLPQHLAIEDEGKLVACAPMYVKGHSYGEYVFDWSWANAYQRAGRAYYPKLQSCVPFTPVGGRRLLVHPDADADRLEPVLLGAMVEMARQLDVSSLHLTFLNEGQWDRCGELGMLKRIGVQYHWENQGYETYDDFLGELMARKRKALKKERREAKASGVVIHPLTGDDLKSEHWEVFYDFYINTIDRKWSSAYLTKEFFHRIGETMKDRIVLMMGKEDGEWVCGALNLWGADALYGRYWGCRSRHKFLHFETCYHQAIDFAIAHRIDRVEAGAQGQHKIKRGYTPVETYSAHYLPEPGFRDAIGGFLEREREVLREEIEALMGESPYKADRAAARAS